MARREEKVDAELLARLESGGDQTANRGLRASHLIRHFRQWASLQDPQDERFAMLLLEPVECRGDPFP